MLHVYFESILGFQEFWLVHVYFESILGFQEFWLVIECYFKFLICSVVKELLVFLFLEFEGCFLKGFEYYSLD